MCCIGVFEPNVTAVSTALENRGQKTGQNKKMRICPSEMFPIHNRAMYSRSNHGHLCDSGRLGT